MKKLQYKHHVCIVLKKTEKQIIDTETYTQSNSFSVVTLASMLLKQLPFRSRLNYTNTFLSAEDQ